MNREIIKYPNVHGVSLTKKGTPTSFPSHWHTSAEFVLIRKKGCRYRIGDDIYTPEAGDLLIIWPRELHEILSAPKDGYTLLQCSSAIMESSTDIAAANRFMVKCHHISKAAHPQLAKELADLISNLSEIYKNETYFKETKCRVEIYKILILIGEHVISEQREILGNEFSDIAWGYIRHACGYLCEHAGEDISQKDVAAEVGLSPFYFSKLFREYTHMSFPAYLADMRVQNAIALLANEKLSITDCAFQSGFQSTTTFNKIFRESTGCTPREYRKMHSNA
ncbi:MAG: AraC family transcriptional regulator [Lachnospiraceae bacterium]|nr:AraC family transcriptional regulator [Lachnospiraceae bacterium]